MNILDWLRWYMFGNKTKDGNRFGALDVPDKRDYVAGHPPYAKFPEHLDLFEKSKLKTRDQGMCGSCTAYGITKVKQVMDTIENRKAFVLDPEMQWERQELTGGTCATGDLLQNALKRGMEYWEDMGVSATEYRIIRDRDVNTLKRWITTGHPIFTGSRVKRYDGADNFSHAKFNNGIVELGKGYTIGAHCFGLFGFTKIDGENYFIGYTDYGTWGKWKTGKFLIRENEIHLLLSCYLVFDTRDDI